MFSMQYRRYSVTEGGTFFLLSLYLYPSPCIAALQLNHIPKSFQKGACCILSGPNLPEKPCIEQGRAEKEAWEETAVRHRLWKSLLRLVPADASPRRERGDRGLQIKKIGFGMHCCCQIHSLQQSPPFPPSSFASFHPPPTPPVFCAGGVGSHHDKDFWYHHISVLLTMLLEHLFQLVWTAFLD